MNFNLRRGVGIGLSFTGLFILMVGRVLTGAVIGIRQENYLGWFGILVFIVGIVMLFIGRKRLG